MLTQRDLVVGVTPFDEPNAQLAVAVQRAGGLGVVGLGRDAAAAQAALRDAVRFSRGGSFGVRVPAGCPLTAADLPDEVDTVIVGLGASWSPTEDHGAVLVEVTSVAEGRQAVAAGATGLIAKGSESGGRVGEITAFVLLQQLLADTTSTFRSGAPVASASTPRPRRWPAAPPVWCSTPSWPWSRESGLNPEVAGAIRAMDGSETTIVDGHRPIYTPAATSRSPASSAAGTCGPSCCRSGRTARSPPPWPTGTRPPAPSSPPSAPPSPPIWHPRSRTALPDRHSSLATARGLTYPVAQGPMTRVSDRAAFAAAVAEGGGLPFLALALMPGAEVRGPARARPPSCSAAGRGASASSASSRPESAPTQLDVVHDVRPAVRADRRRPAVAGGAARGGRHRHLPPRAVPGLLDRFLKDGARKFVFEGRECGGHVGPRSSFALWDAQIERLLTFATDDQPDGRAACSSPAASTTSVRRPWWRRRRAAGRTRAPRSGC